MKVSIGANIQSGPWGGGIAFVRKLREYLEGQGCEVITHLNEEGIDVILMIEPDYGLTTSAYNHSDIMQYLLFTDSNPIVVHRVNNSSEARDDPKKQFNRFRIFANTVADHTVFVSEWLKNTYVKSGYSDDDFTIIHNGADSEKWYPSDHNYGAEDPLSIVTHHWSTNMKKGFDIYQRLDRLLSKEKYRQQFQFTYVGRLPESVEFENTNYIEPLSGESLASEIRSHDIYLTASRNEAGPMHCVEGGMSGLPLLYINSGSMPEYCDGFGVSFEPNNFEKRLNEIYERYSDLSRKMEEYPFSMEKTCESYYDLFERLLDNRDKVQCKREFLKHPGFLFDTLLRQPAFRSAKNLAKGILSWIG